MPKQGDLKVWWIPQIPGKSFEVRVNDIDEAKLLLKTLARYDLFQYENHIKPDYSNAGGLLMYEPECIDNDPEYPCNGWIDWCDDNGEPLERY